MNNFKDFLKITIFVLVLFWLIKVFDISYPLTITTQTKTSELSVVGEGKVEVVPDTAYIDVGILVENEPTVKKAQEKIDLINNKIIKTLEKLNISKKDIKTSNYSIYPNYKYENNINTISGYNGNVTVTIKAKNIEVVPQIISKSTEAGANQVQGVRFTIDKPEIYREQARKKAIENAKDQAKKLAKDLNIRLGKITNVVESNSSQPMPFYAKTMADGLGGGGGPEIEPGSQTITSVVTLYFEKR